MAIFLDYFLTRKNLKVEKLIKFKCLKNWLNAELIGKLETFSSVKLGKSEKWKAIEIFFHENSEIWYMKHQLLFDNNRHKIVPFDVHKIWINVDSQCSEDHQFNDSNT